MSYPGDEYIPECGGIKIILHGCDMSDTTDQAPFKLEGFDDTYWIDDFEELKKTVIHELDRWKKKQEKTK